jgi:pyruvate dehydrogenase E1 component alpha subunit
MYLTATTILQCDDRFRSLISSGQVIAGSYHPVRGQEIIAAAMGTHLTPKDYVVTIYRGLHDQIAKGVPLRAIWAEFLGRRDGSCGGKGGPMHITYPEAGLMVTTGIVGAGIPIANGFALSAQLRGTDQVTVVSFGDGATNIGGFHEALNLASVWSLPVVFLCQNNGYAEHTPYGATARNDNVAARAAAYAMPGVRVNGNDAAAMWAAAGEAVSRARAGDGPTLLEACTYRFFGHSFGDAMEYMPAEERATAMSADPVAALRAHLLEAGVCSAEEIDAMNNEAKVAIDEAVAFAMASPPPSPDALFADVFAEVAS